MIYSGGKVNDNHWFALAFCEIQKDQWYMPNGYAANTMCTFVSAEPICGFLEINVESACDSKWKIKAII